MIDTVIVVRHAERMDFEDENWVYTTATPWDSPLSDTGHATAQRIADEMAKLDVSSPVQLLCSPFRRCIETSMPIAELFSTKISLCSVFGEWMNTDYFPLGTPPPDNLQTVAQMNYSEILMSQPQKSALIDFTFDITTFGPSGSYGEAWDEMHDRAVRGITSVLNQRNGTLVVVTHGSLCNSIIAELKNTPQMQHIAMGEWVCIRR